MDSRWLLPCVLAIACSGKTKVDHFGDRFFSGGDGRRVVCSKGIDRGHEWTHDRLVHSLEHARDAGVVLQTYGHAPTIDLDIGTLRFVPATDGRGEGLGGIDLRIPRHERAWRAARSKEVATDGDALMLCGTRVRLV